MTAQLQDLPNRLCEPFGRCGHPGLMPERLHLVALKQFVREAVVCYSITLLFEPRPNFLRQDVKVEAFDKVKIVASEMPQLLAALLTKYFRMAGFSHRPIARL